MITGDLECLTDDHTHAKRTEPDTAFCGAAFDADARPSARQSGEDPGAIIFARFHAPERPTERRTSRVEDREDEDSLISGVSCLGQEQGLINLSSVYHDRNE